LSAGQGTCLAACYTLPGTSGGSPAYEYHGRKHGVAVKREVAGHKWMFSPRFRRHAFGWRGSRPAIVRVKEAVSEIKKASKKNGLLGAEGAVLLLEKLSPALGQVDSSSGARRSLLKHNPSTISCY